VIVTPYFTVITVKYGTVYGTVVRLTGYGKKCAWRIFTSFTKFQFFQSSSCISITPFSTPRLPKPEGGGAQLRGVGEAAGPQ